MVVLVGSEIPRGISGAGRQGKYTGCEGQIRTFFRTTLRDSLIPGVMQFVCVAKDPKNKVLITQSCPTLCDPMDCSLTGSSVHGDSPGRNTGVGCHARLQGIFPAKGSNPGLLCLLH